MYDVSWSLWYIVFQVVALSSINFDISFVVRISGRVNIHMYSHLQERSMGSNPSMRMRIHTAKIHGKLKSDARLNTLTYKRNFDKKKCKKRHDGR